MADSRFWRTLGVSSVAGVFYLAHGLHDPASIGSIPSLTQELQAGDVSIIGKPNNNILKIVTTSDDGHTLYVWSTTTGSDIPKYVGKVVAR
ncbi:MAG: hypothetical protein ACI8P0_001399 [Planctomycetaceae bacterium]|jgi:hypothetical protein